MARPLAPRGQGRSRVVRAALELFAEHGVAGTSLQMIADHLGVTKAAVYYQFHAKEDIVVAVVGPALEALTAVADEAERAESPRERTELALRGVVELVIEHRQVMGALFRDPEFARILEGRPEFASGSLRISDLLHGPAPDVRRRISVSVVGAGIAQAGLDPDLADVDPAVLREELLRIGGLLLATTTV